jgi:hypothetical protein
LTGFAYFGKWLIFAKGEDFCKWRASCVIFVGGDPYGRPVSNSNGSFVGKPAVGSVDSKDLGKKARIPPDVDLRKLRSDPKLLKNLQPPGLLGVIREVKAEIEKLQALLVRTVAELSEQRADSDVVVGEVAAELSLSADDARRSIVDAEALTSRLPRTLALMETGELDLERAAKVSGATAGLSDDDARKVDEALEKRLPGKDATQVQKAAAYVARKVDPGGPERRTRKRDRSRRIAATYHRIGTASLSITNASAGRVNAAFERVDRLAREFRGEMRSRTLDELRADVAIGLLIGDAESGAEPPPATEPFSSAASRRKRPRQGGFGLGWLRRSRRAERKSCSG